ncbi:calcium-binding protein [Geminicoccus harenae]|uniref:calcium-binding protein n=1 Tax=Geminicoccus harenae TaxID=2498453 RepID=UPI00168A4B01|nr:calcium-binding protein [Geminicoccus harenae]
MATLTGSTSEDSIRGTLEDDRIDGLAREDFLLGRAGNDRIAGGSGADHIEGGLGHDRLLGGPGADELLGNDGNDQIFGDAGRDVIAGGAGDDLLFGNTDTDILSGGTGNDRLSGGQGDDFLFGGPGHDLLEGGSGADEFDFVIQRYQGVDLQSGRDIILDFQSFDRLVAIWSAGVIEPRQSADIVRLSFDLLDDNQSGRLGDGDRAATIQAVTVEGQTRNSLLLDLVEALNLPHGSAQTITLFGVTELAPEAIGNFGSRTPFTLTGTDDPEGFGAGEDSVVILAGGGNDEVRGGPGSDRIEGGAGDDVVLGEGGEDHIFGGTGHDILDGGAGEDVLQGDSGNDILSGGAGEDVLRGDHQGRGVVDPALSGDDRLDGGDGDDRLLAGPGNDLLIGGQGRDRITIEHGSSKFFPLDERPMHLTIGDFTNGEDTLVFGFDEDVFIMFHMLDTDGNLQVDTFDRGTALVTRSVDGIDQQGLLIDLGFISGLVPLQTQEIFLVGINHLARNDVETWL